MRVARLFLKIALLSVFLLIVIAIAGYFITFSKWTYTKFLPETISKKYSDIELSDVTLSQIRHKRFDPILFENYRGLLRWKESKFHFEISELLVSGAKDHVLSQKPLSLKGGSTDVISSLFDALVASSMVNLKFDANKKIDFAGEMKIQEITVLGFVFEDADIDFLGNDQEFFAEVNSVQAYNGHLSGWTKMKLSDQNRIAAEGVFENLDVGDLSEATPVIPTDIDMLVSGSLEISADQNVANLFSDDSNLNYRGLFGLNENNIFGYEIGNTSAHLQGNNRQLNIDVPTTSFYGGTIQVNFKTELTANRPHQIDVVLDQVDLAQMDQMSLGIVENFKGIISGKIKLVGNEDSITSIEVDVKAEPGAEVRASLLGVLINYIPERSTQRKCIQNLIDNDEYMPMAFAATQGKSIDQKLFKLNFQFKNEPCNLNFNPELDISLDGGLLGLFRTVGKFHVNRSR